MCLAVCWRLSRWSHLSQLLNLSRHLVTSHLTPSPNTRESHSLFPLCHSVSRYLFLCPFLCMASSSAIYGSAPTYPSRMVCVADLPRLCSLHCARSSRLLVAPTRPGLLEDKKGGIDLGLELEVFILVLKKKSWSQLWSW